MRSTSFKPCLALISTKTRRSLEDQKRSSDHCLSTMEKHSGLTLFAFGHNYQIVAPTPVSHENRIPASPQELIFAEPRRGLEHECNPRESHYRHRQQVLKKMLTGRLLVLTMLRLRIAFKRLDLPTLARPDHPDLQKPLSYGKTRNTCKQNLV